MTASFSVEVSLRVHHCLSLLDDIIDTAKIASPLSQSLPRQGGRQNLHPPEISEPQNWFIVYMICSRRLHDGFHFSQDLEYSVHGEL